MRPRVALSAMAVAALFLGTFSAIPASLASPVALEAFATTTSPGYTETGAWQQSTEPSIQAGGKTRFTREAGATATWRVTAPTTSEYTLDVWVAASTVNTTDARYTWSPDGTTPVTVNQQAAGGRWYTLGRLELTSGSPVAVTVTAQIQGSVTRADAVRIRSTDLGHPVYLNQSGFDTGRTKRFTAPLTPDGSTFTISTQGADEVLFSGSVVDHVGDLTAFNPTIPGPYVVTVRGPDGAKDTSDPFGIGPFWTNRVALPNAVAFMAESRCGFGDASVLDFEDRKGDHCNPGNTGVAWRDSHQFSFELPSLVTMFLANPSYYVNSGPAVGRYEGLTYPTTPDAPEIAKLINWGADIYLDGKVSSDLLKEQLAWFVYAYPYLSQWIPQAQYDRAVDYLFAQWGDSSCTRWEYYQVSHTCDLFQTYDVIGTGKGQFPPGHSIIPNLMMQEVARREDRPGNRAFLDAAIRNTQWVIDNVDWSDPTTTKGQRMSERITLESLAYVAEQYPAKAPAGLGDKIEDWARVAVSRSENMWDFRRYSEDRWVIPDFNEPGNVAGFPAAALAAARVIDDPDLDADLRRIAAGQVDDVFGRNPMGVAFSYEGAEPGGWEGVERGWPTRYVGGNGQLQGVPGVLDGSPKDDAYPYNPDAGPGYTEGWVAFNTAWNDTLAYLGLDQTRLRSVDPDSGQAVESVRSRGPLVVSLNAPLDRDPSVADSGVVQVSSSSGDHESLPVTETGPGSSTFRGDLDTRLGRSRPGDGVLDTHVGDVITISYGYGPFATTTEVRVVSPQ